MYLTPAIKFNDGRNMNTRKFAYALAVVMLLVGVEVSVGINSKEELTGAC